MSELMTPNNDENPVIAYRRTVVGSYLMRGKTLRYIVSRLPQLNPPVINPETMEPYSLATIKRDADALKAEWASVRLENTDELVGKETSKLDEMEDQLWQDMARVQNNLNSSETNFEFLAHIQTKGAILDRMVKVATRRAKLLGLDHETRMRLSSDEHLTISADAMVAIQDLNLTMPEITALINQLIIRQAQKKLEAENVD